MTNWSDLSLFVGAVSASLASLILAIQKSKCSTIDCGCVHCNRVVELPPVDEPEPEPPEPMNRDAPVRFRDLETNLNPPTRDVSEIV